MTVLYFRVLQQIYYNDFNSICVIYTFIMDMDVNSTSIWYFTHKIGYIMIGKVITISLLSSWPSLLTSDDMCEWKGTIAIQRNRNLYASWNRRCHMGQCGNTK